MIYQPPTKTSFMSAPSALYSGSLSLFLALLWPLSLAVQIVATILGNNQISVPLAFGTALILLLAPPIGIIAGHIGLRQANQSTTLHHLRWRAIVGLIFSYLWLVSIFFISDLGPALIYWFQHLGR